MACKTFEISRLSYYNYRQRHNIIETEWFAVRAQVKRLFTKSLNSAGSGTITSMLREDGVIIGRFKVRRLMSELALICKQPSAHTYKNATVERPDIPNNLAREFAVAQPNQV